MNNIEELALNAAVKAANILWPEVPAYHSELTNEDKRFYCTFADLFLAELAKQSEPIGHVGDGLLDNGIACMARLNDTHPVGTPVFTHPLPQPDLVAEIERKDWALLMNADIEQLRQQLSAAQAEIDALRKANGYHVTNSKAVYEEATRLKLALVAAQAYNATRTDELLASVKQAAENW